MYLSAKLSEKSRMNWSWRDTKVTTNLSFITNVYYKMLDFFLLHTEKLQLKWVSPVWRKIICHVSVSNFLLDFLC